MKFAWISQPLWIAKDSEVLDKTRLWFMIFWKHFDTLFVTFFICFFLALAALLFFLKAYRDQGLHSTNTIVFSLLGAISLTLILLTAIKLPKFFWTEPLKQARSLNVDIQMSGMSSFVKPCKILSAKYLYHDEPGFWNSLNLFIKIELEITTDSDLTETIQLVEILPRYFRGHLLNQKFPIDGWIWYNNKNQSFAFLGINENQIDKSFTLFGHKFE